MPFPQPSEQYFRKVNLEITTVCNLTCPECSAATNGSGRRKAVHHPWEYFEEAARWLRGTESVVITGGEPTSHPKFAEFAPRFRALFGCRELILWTNGFKVKQYADLIRQTFDVVHTSLYDERTAPWNKKPNGDMVQFIKGEFRNATMEEPHIQLIDETRSGAICGRGIHGPITYADGKLWGCCVAPGLPSGRGLEPSQNWRDELMRLPLACGECGFSPAKN